MLVLVASGLLLACGELSNVEKENPNGATTATDESGPLPISDQGGGSPSWSPDGMQIAFECFTTNYYESDICVAEVDGSGQTKLTEGSARDFNPTWSPDGTKLAFERFGNILTVNADGTGLMNLTNGDPSIEITDTIPAWSPDGEQVAFVRIGMIFIAKADGTGLNNFIGSESDISSLTWSPDGTRLAFASNGDIFTVNSDSTEQANITRSEQWDENPTWSPKENIIAFESTPVGGEEIYTVKADGSRQKNLTKELGALDAMPTWSADGNKIAFVSNRNGRENIFTMNKDGTEQVNITKFTGSPNRREGTSTVSITTQHPTWSPDGRQIAFESTHAPGSLRIYATDAGEPSQ